MKMTNTERQNLTYRILKERYDYLYLRGATELIGVDRPEGLTYITGSSHALNGIDLFCYCLIS